MSAMIYSVDVDGGTPLLHVAWPLLNASGSIRRSIFPFGVSGNASTVAIIEGIMNSGSR